MTNWKTYVAKTNAKTFTLPEGWDSRETIAEQLGCSPEKVAEHLRPGLNAGEIEKQQFPVWSAQLGRKVMVWAFRHVKQANDNGKQTRPTVQQVLDLKNSGKTWNEIGAQFSMTGEAVRRMTRQ